MPSRLAALLAFFMVCGGIGAACQPPTVVTEVSAPPARQDLFYTLTAQTWELLKAERGGVEFVKLVVIRGAVDDPLDNQVLFFDPEVHPLHIDFLQKNGFVSRSAVDAVQRHTWTSDERRYVFANLSQYHAPDGARWVLETFEHDEASPAMLAELFATVRPRCFVGSELRYKPNSLEQAARAEAVRAAGVGVVDNHDLAVDLPFLVQNVGQAAVGRLRVVDEDDPLQVENELYNRDEIVLLGTIPNDITRVAGIITLEPTTPLSHVNLRARSWDIPNVMIREALGMVWREGWEGQWVYLAVGSDGVPTLRAARPEELAARASAPAPTPGFQVPQVDLRPRGLPSLDDLRATDVGSVGAKAANLGELRFLSREAMRAASQRALGEGDRAPLASPTFAAQSDGEALMIPPGFVVPMAVYASFLALPDNAPVQESIDQALKDPRFHEEPAYRRDKLARIRGLIEGGVFPPEEARAIVDAVTTRLRGQPVFVRSSTNAEDLPGFNGAGLYATVPNVQGGDAILQAIKVVWASVWRLGAYEAREDRGVDHQSVYPAAIIQQAIKPDAAGVLVTRDVLSRHASEPGTTYINANPGPGTNVVQTGMRPEQIYVDTLSGAVHRISVSQARPTPVISDTVARRLAWLGALIEAHFAVLGGQGGGPQDIEWLVEGDAVWVVQARPWVGRWEGGL